MKAKGQYANRQLQKYTSFSKGCEYSLAPQKHNPGKMEIHIVQLFAVVFPLLIVRSPVTRNAGLIQVTCKTCTPGQTTELTCYICDTTKGLDEFAKNQRKDPDKARCTKCVNRVLDTEPDMSPPSSDAEEEEDTDNEEVRFCSIQFRILSLILLTILVGLVQRRQKICR